MSEPGYEVTRDSVLYIVDASVAMESADALTAALDSAGWAIRDSAREGVARNDAGVVVYNAAKEGSTSAAHVLLSLSEPKTDDLKRLIRLAKSAETFRTAFTPAEPRGSALVAALRLANAELNRLHTRSLRRVVLITNDDEPMRDDASAAPVAMNLAADLTSSPAFLMPIFLKTPSFDTQKFWINISYLPPPMHTPHADEMYTNTKLLEPWDVETLANPKHALILAKSRRKYVSFKGALVVGALPIGVRGYSVLHAYHRPTPLKVAHVTEKTGKMSLQMLVGERVSAFADSGSRVPEKVEETKKFKLGSAVKNEEDWTVPVSAAELAQLGTSTLPSSPHSEPPCTTIVVHRFVPQNTVELPGILGHSLFVTPGTDFVTNAWPAFAALHRSMRRRQVAARATLYPLKRPNQTNSPVSGFLFAHYSDHEPSPSTAAGLYFVHAPYAGDLRPLPPSSASKYLATTNQEPNDNRDSKENPEFKDAVNKLCSKFTLRAGFAPTRFKNPLAEQFASIFEYHALSIPLEKDGLEAKDDTRPRYDRIAKTSSSLSKHVANILAAIAPPEPTPEPPAKRSKAGVSSAEVLEAYAAQHLNKFTVSQLKNVVSQYELPISTLKAPLVEQLEQIISKGFIK